MSLLLLSCECLSFHDDTLTMNIHNQKVIGLVSGPRIFCVTVLDALVS